MLRPSTCGGASRRIAATVALALLVGNLLAFLHHVVVRHSVCAEHGESIHLSADVGHEGDNDNGTSVARSEEPSRMVAGPTEHAPNERTHAHCDLRACALGVADVPPAPTVVEIPERVDVELLVTETAGLLRSQDPLFRLAPKNSPPHLRA